MMLTMIYAYMKRIQTRLSPVLLIVIGLVALLSLRMMYAAAELSGSAGGFFSLSTLYGDGDEKDASRQAILKWMQQNSEMPEDVLTTIYDAAEQTGNRDLILAICLVESNFNPQAVSHKGAIGLMGIMPGVWLQELQEKGIVRQKNDLYKISENIAAGAHVLETYLSETADLRRALSRYVGGASWYATRVFKAQRKIELAQASGQLLAYAAVED